MHEYLLTFDGISVAIGNDCIYMWINSKRCNVCESAGCHRTHINDAHYSTQILFHRFFYFFLFFSSFAKPFVLAQTRHMYYAYRDIWRLCSAGCWWQFIRQRSSLTCGRVYILQDNFDQMLHSMCGAVWWCDAFPFMKVALAFTEQTEIARNAVFIGEKFICHIVEEHTVFSFSIPNGWMVGWL